MKALKVGTVKLNDSKNKFDITLLCFNRLIYMGSSLEMSSFGIIWWHCLPYIAFNEIIVLIVVFLEDGVHSVCNMCRWVICQCQLYSPHSRGRQSSDRLKVLEFSYLRKSKKMVWGHWVMLKFFENCLMLLPMCFCFNFYFLQAPSSHQWCFLIAHPLMFISTLHLLAEVEIKN